MASARREREWGDPARRGPRLRTADPAAREDHLRRPQLPQPHPRDGARHPRVPDAVREVLAGADRCERRHRLPRCPSRSTGRPSSRSSSASAVRHATSRVTHPTRSRGTRCATTSRCATGRTARSQWLQGKTFEATHAARPVAGHLRRARPGRHARDLVRGRRRGGAEGRHVRPRVRPVTLVSYCSNIITLAARRRDLARARPGGWAMPATRKEFLRDGGVMITRIAGLGECRNVCRRETR